MFCLLTYNRINVLIVPIDPISPEDFSKYSTAIKQFDSVYLGDMQHKKQSTYDLFHAGHAIFQYTTTYHSDHAQLEDFHIHKQVMGVIGIMTSSTKESYQRFTKHIQKYQNCLAHRCFVFDPSDTPNSDVKVLTFLI